MVVHGMVYSNDSPLLGTIKGNLSICNFSILRCTSAFTSIARKVIQIERPFSSISRGFSRIEIHKFIKVVQFFSLSKFSNILHLRLR